MSNKNKDLIDHDPILLCLQALLDSIGWRGDKRFIIEAMPLDGFNDSDEMKFVTSMANIGFNHIFFPRKNLKFAKKKELPALFVDKKGNPYILLKAEEKGIFAFDGRSKKYTTLEKLSLRGNYYFFEEIPKEVVTLADPQPFWFTNLVSRFKEYLLSFTFISLILSLLLSLSPLFIMFVYDQIKYKSDAASLTMLGVAILIYILAFSWAVYLQSSILRVVSTRIGNIVNNQVMRRVLYLPLSFTEMTSLSSQIARLKDFVNIQSFFGGSPFATITELPFVVLLIFVLYLLGGNIIVIPIITIALFIVFCVIVKSVVSQLNIKIAGVGSRKQEILLEILSRYSAIKLSGKRKFWEERFNDLSADWAFQKYKDAKLNGLISSFSSFLVSISALSTIYWGVIKVLDNDMSPGGLMATMILVWRILAPIRSGFFVLSQTSSIFKSISQLNRLMNMPLDISRTQKETMTRKLKGDINVSQLYLKYIPDAEPALAAIDLVINQGETVVICGHEGSGKSSLIKLISSLYAYQSGHISLDHVNIKQMQPVTLRKSLTFIPQYIQLFSGSLESNLRAFNPAATRDEMLWAIEKVGLSDEIEELTFGLDTMVTSQNRKQFSNSFVRLFFIAAALLRDTGIVIVDEGTKGLNKKDLNKVVEIFKELKETKTLVIIASQKPIFEIADKILWLDQGRVRKFGEKDEIINEYFEVGV